MKPARDVAMECAPKCPMCDGTKVVPRAMSYAMVPCDTCSGTGRLGADAIEAAIEADRELRSFSMDRHLEVVVEYGRLLTEVAALKAQLDEAAALLRDWKRKDADYSNKTFYKTQEWLAKYDAGRTK